MINCVISSDKVRRNGVQVYANSQPSRANGGHLCGNVTGRKDGTDIPDTVTITCNVNARFVTIYQATDNGYSTALDFLEVEVYGNCNNSNYLPLTVLKSRCLSGTVECFITSIILGHPRSITIAKCVPAVGDANII